MRATAMVKLWMLVMAFVLPVGLSAGLPVWAADLSVSVLLQGSSGNANPQTYQLGDPISAKLAISNESGSDIVISSNFPAREFHLDLQFTRFLPDNRKEIYTALTPVNMDEPLKPKMRFTVNEEVVNTPVEQVEILPPGWASGTEWFPTFDHYPELPVGRYEVRAVIPREIYDGQNILISDDGFSYQAIGTSIIDGDLISAPVAFHIVADGDGDGYTYPEAFGAQESQADCDDEDASVFPGAQEVAGDGKDNDCDPATPDVETADSGYIKVRARKFTIDFGSFPRLTREPIVGMPLRVYLKSQGSCVDQLYGIAWRNYPNIWWGCNPAVVEGVTGDDGTAILTVPPGSYVLIGLQDLNGIPRDDEDIYIGRTFVNVKAGETTKKYMPIFAKANGRRVATKCTRRTGSELLIFEPEYIEWDGTEEQYPFVFESEGDWDVTTSVSPPEGFVSDHNSLSEQVEDGVKAVQFVITDIGSEWIDTNVVHEVKHKGKKEKIKTKIGVKLSKKLAKKKGLDRYGKKLKKNKKKKKVKKKK